MTNVERRVLLNPAPGIYTYFFQVPRFISLVFKRNEVDFTQSDSFNIFLIPGFISRVFKYKKIY